MKEFIYRHGRAWRRRNGQTLFEYAVIIAIVSIAAVLVLRAIGQRPPEMMDPVQQELGK